MGLGLRKNGISVLIACQNEEAMVGLSILSFLDFGDELIVVDNGSTDRTKDIVRELESKHPRKIKFFDAPHLIHLYENRQYALERSSRRWVVRADADFVAYTDGPYDISEFRDRLLRQSRSLLPGAYAVFAPNVSGDFWHTGFERGPQNLGPDDPGRFVPPPVSAPMLRVYEVFPGFKFQRRGRWEATSFHLLLRWRRIVLDRPLWMHCNIKSDLNCLCRSERTNWRELGDFKSFPTLDSYLQHVVPQKYGTTNIAEAAEVYMRTRFLPFLQPYRPARYPFPKLVREQMKRDPIYRIVRRDGMLKRDRLRSDVPPPPGEDPNVADRL